MKKSINILAVPALTLLLAFLAPDHLRPAEKKRTVVGSSVCASCHAAESIGNQYDRWLRSPHAKAVLILKTQPALALAKKLSIADPAADRKCLACHTTGRGKVDKTKDEGVGCEACHGPGSDYHEFGRHVDTVNRQGAYETALKNGMYPILGIKNIKKREKLCLHCHTKGRPCYPVLAEDIYRQTISLQVISELRKGDLNLKHQLIPPFPQY
ncbi:MAG: hypothetical protein JW807_17820 [Spirochaetes bacterium]|nr:hypothetical protein [Spirochaetota bacterium]